MQFEPGSFRDPAGRVFYHNDRVYRSVDPNSEPLLPPSDVAGFWPAAWIDHPMGNEKAVTQPTLPLVSYPYEWSFEMLRDAALHTLKLQLELLTRGLSLKDATAFNITFVGCEPTHFDCYSVEPYPTTGLWPAFGQFSRAFLNPLLVWSYKSIDPRPWLQAGLGELTHDTTLKLLGRAALLKKGVFKNVYLPCLLENMVSNKKATSAPALQSLQMPLEHTKRMIEKTLSLVAHLPQPRGTGVWNGYTQTCTYQDADTQRKEAFVQNALLKIAPHRVIDIGSNTGHYSHLAAQTAAQVLACDLDSQCIDALYLQCKKEDRLKNTIFPLVLDLTRPAPALGWRLTERKDAFHRLKSDAFLALAVVHHLRITGGIPVREILDAFATLAPGGVIEWVGPNDPMVKELNAFRKLDLTDLHWTNFKSAVEERFDILTTQTIKSEQRILLSVQKRSQ